MCTTKLVNTYYTGGTRIGDALATGIQAPAGHEGCNTNKHYKVPDAAYISNAKLFSLYRCFTGKTHLSCNSYIVVYTILQPISILKKSAYCLSS